MKVGQGLGSVLASGVAAIWVVAWVPVLEQAALEVSGALSASETPCEVIGQAGAVHKVVYLHGLDTYGPAWIEIQNRETLRALAALLDLTIALPRAPMRRWPQGDDAALGESLGIIDRAARRTFPAARRYGLLGFSNGGYLTTELYLRGVSDSIAYTVVAGCGASRLPSRTAGPGRVPIVLIAGRAEPTYREARTLAALLAKRGDDARLVEHPGAHGLHFAATYEALRRLLAEEPR